MLYLFLMKSIRHCSAQNAASEKRAFATMVLRALDERRSVYENQTAFAAKLHIGTDFLSRVLAGQRWPELDAVPDWASALHVSARQLLMAWLHDKAPAAFDALTNTSGKEAVDQIAAELAPSFVETARKLARLPSEVRRHLEALISHLVRLHEGEGSSRV